MTRAFFVTVFFALVFLPTACRSDTSHRATPAASTPTAVPWIAEAAPPYIPVTPLPNPPRPADIRPCSAAQMTFTEREGQGGAGSVFYSFLVTNTSDADCWAAGPVEAIALEPGRDPVTLSYDDGLGSGVEGAVPPNGQAAIQFRRFYACRLNPGAPGPNEYHQLLFRFGGTEQLVPALTETSCGVVTGPLSLLGARVYPPDPFADLRVELVLPPTVRRGATLHFLVRLTNPNDADVRLDPCPGYLQAFGDKKEQLLLNCAARPTIRAHDTIDFEMQVGVSGDLPVGVGPLRWSLVSSGSRQADATIEVTD